MNQMLRKFSPSQFACARDFLCGSSSRGAGYRCAIGGNRLGFNWRRGPWRSLDGAQRGHRLDQKSDSDAVGGFVFRELPPGVYTLSVNADGFSSFVAKGVQLTVEQHATLPVRLKIGGSTETVTVTGA